MALNKLLLLLEDVLELSKGGLHLLQGELVLALRGLVLGNPRVQLSDGVVEQGPFLKEDIDLLHPFVADSLDLVVPLLEVRWLGETLSSGLLSSGQPGRVLLDSGPVLSPE